MVAFIGNKGGGKNGLYTPNLVLPDSAVICAGGSLFGGVPFTTQWTVAGDAAARTVTVPLVSGYSYNCVVDWGDGTTPSLVVAYNDANRIHTYASNGTYIVKIYGVMEGWSFNNGGDCLKITKVIDFGVGSFEGFKYLSGGFFGCTNLTSIGTRPIPASGDGVEADGFFRTFQECQFPSVPSGLLDKHTMAITCFGIFRNCSVLERLPSGVFAKLLSAIDFQYAVSNCFKLQQNIDLFYAAGEHTTRFLDQSPNFTSCFERASFTGIQGTAPDLWNCNFGIGTPTPTGCWNGAGNSLTSLTNYAVIPVAWGGPA